MNEGNYEEEEREGSDRDDSYGDEAFGSSGDSDIMEWCPNCSDVKPHIQVGEGGVKIKCLECNLEHLRDDAQDDSFEEAVPHEEDLSTEEARHAAWLLHTNVDESEMIPYSIRIRPKVGDVIRHSKFGIGVVVKLGDATRAEILFKDEIRRLVCGK